LGDDTTALDRHPSVTVIVEAVAQHTRSGGEDSVGIALAHVQPGDDVGR